MSDKYAFICFYGQIREIDKTVISLKDLLERLRKDGYDVKIFAHSWFDYDEIEYDASYRKGVISKKENLDFFLNEFRPTKILIENSKKFSLPEPTFSKVNLKGKGSNILSQMNSRMKVSNLVTEYCKDYSIDSVESPVFMLRTDFGNIVNPNIINEFVSNPNLMYIAQRFALNDNFIVLSLGNFMKFFNSLSDRIPEYLNNSNTLPKIYGWWCPESILAERQVEMGLEIFRSWNIPNFE